MGSIKNIQERISNRKTQQQDKSKLKITCLLNNKDIYEAHRVADAKNKKKKKTLGFTGSLQNQILHLCKYF